MATQKKPAGGGAARSAAAAKSKIGKGTRTREPETVGSLRAERDALRRRLAAAEARIADLETRQKAVLDRLDWTIDSLSTLAELSASGRRLGASNSRN